MIMTLVADAKEQNRLKPMAKPTLILIQSTDSPVKEHLQKGIWERQKFSLSQYAREFSVVYYTSDQANNQSLMPPGVKHRTPRFSVETFGLSHIIYYIFLVIEAFSWRKAHNVSVRIIGVNVPVVPVLKIICRKRLAISYQFDWANGMKKDYKGIKPLVSGAVQSWVIGAADRLICTTEWLSEIARSRYKISPESITIIPNYVNTEVFRPEYPKKKQIAFAGRLHWSKGIDTLVNAFLKFSKEFPDYKLIIMGVGEEETVLKKLAGNSSMILFTGGVNNRSVAQYFNESEMFVLPTVNMEGHPKALVEAMASGCKCIASDVPGNNHVLSESGSPDLLFQSQNVESLYQKLCYAVTRNKDDQYRHALKNFSAQECFEKEFRILKSIIS